MKALWLASAALIFAVPLMPGQEKPFENLPARALQRFGTTHLRHGSRVMCLAFSPDGKTLAAGGGNDPIRLWDTATGAPLQVLPERWARSLSFSPRGTVLVSAGSFKKIRLWKSAGGKEVATLEAHGHPVSTLASSRDGALLASAGADGTLLLWELATREVIAPLKGHQDEIETLAFSNDGRRLASAGADRTIRVWDTQRYEQLQRFDAGCHALAVIFSNDGKTLFGAGDDGLIRTWDVDSGKPLATLDPRRAGESSSPAGITALTMSPDGATLYSSDQNGTITFWNVADGKPSRSIACHPGDGDAMALSRDGTLLAVAGSNNTIRLFDTKTGKERFDDRGPRMPLTSAALSRDGKLLVTAGRNPEIHLVDPATGQEIRQLSRRGASPRAPRVNHPLALSPDSKTLAEAAGNIALWDVHTGKQLDELAIPAGEAVLSLCYTREALAVGHRSGLVQLWNTSQKKVVHALKSSGPVHALAVSHDGKALAASGGSQVDIWELGSGNALQHFVSRPGPPTTQPAVAALAFSPDGATIALACYDAAVRLFDRTTGKQTRALEGHGSAVLSLAFSSDGRTLATGSFDHTVRLWEVFSGQPIATFPGHVGPVHTVLFGPENRTVVSSSADTSARVWDVAGFGRVLPLMNLGPQELQSAWNDLSLEDAGRGQRTVWTLIGSEASSVAFLSTQLVLVDPKHIDRLIVDLDSKQFDVRNKATTELMRYGMWMKVRLEQAMKDAPTEEVRRRVEQLLARLQSPGVLPLPRERIRVQRIMQLLEHLGTPTCQAILDKLVLGAPEEFLQIEAHKSLERLRRRL